MSLRVTYQLVTGIDHSSVGVDPLDEQRGFPGAETRDIRKQICSVRITHCLVDIDTAKVNHVNHSSLKVLQKLVLRQVLLVRVDRQRGDVLSERCIFFHGVLEIASECDAVPRQ